MIYKNHYIFGERRSIASVRDVAVDTIHAADQTALEFARANLFDDAGTPSVSSQDLIKTVRAMALLCAEEGGKYRDLAGPAAATTG